MGYKGAEKQLALAGVLLIFICHALWAGAPGRAAPKKQPPSRKLVPKVKPGVPVTALCFDRTGKILAQGIRGGVALWDLNAACLKSYLSARSMEGPIRSLCFLPGRSLIACGCGNDGRSGTVHLFPLARSSEEVCLQGAEDSILSLACDPSEKLLAAASADGRVYVYNLERKRLEHEIQGHSDWVTGIGFLAGGSEFATCSCDRTVRFWNVKDFSSAGSVTFSEAVWSFGIGPRGQLIAAALAGPTEQVVEVRRRKNGRLFFSLFPGARPLTLFWHHRSDRLFVGCSDGALRVYDMRRRRLVQTLRKDGDWITSVALRADGKVCAVGYGGGEVNLWNMQQGRLVATLYLLGSGNKDFAIVTAGGKVVCGDSMRILDTAKAGGGSSRGWFVDREAVLSALKAADRPVEKQARKRKPKPVRPGRSKKRR